MYRSGRIEGMTNSETDAGTPVVEMTVEEHEDFLNEEAWRRLDMSVDDFRHRYEAGELEGPEAENVDATLVFAGEMLVLCAVQNELVASSRETVRQWEAKGLGWVTGIGEFGRQLTATPGWRLP